MKIAIFSIAHPSYGGGFEQQIKKLSVGLKRRNHEITLITLSKRSTYSLAILLSFLYFRPRFSFPEIQQDTGAKGITLKTFSNLKGVKQLLREYNVIYAKNELLDSLILSFIKDKNTPPIICGVHTVLQYANAQKFHSNIHNFFYNSGFYKKLLSVFSAYHCINKYQVDFLKKWVIKKSIFYIPNFIYVPKNKIKSEKKSFELLYVGRLTEQKGIDTLIRVIEKISYQPFFKTTKITICGAGEFDNQIKLLTRRFTNITYKGFVDQNVLKTIYEKTDVLLFPSRGESFPVTLLEALSFGVLVIGFDIPGVKDAITDGENGYLVRSESINAMANKLIMIYNLKRKKYATFLDLKLKARERIKKYYSTEKLMVEYEKMFESVYKL